MKCKIISSILLSFIMSSSLSYGNENYSKNFQEHINFASSENKYVCDDLREGVREIEAEDCMSALRTYNKQRKSEGKPTCSVRRLSKNRHGCYCFPRVAKGKELTHMCQKKNFYKNDQPTYQIGGM